MTIDEAIRIIDPDTTREALAPYADCDTRRAVVDEACRVAVEALKKAKPQSTALFTTHPSKDLDPVEWVKEDAP